MATPLIGALEDAAGYPELQKDRVSLACAVVMAVLALAWLSWLLWAYVPSHAYVFEVMAMPLPRPAIIALQGSVAFVRCLPYLVLLLILASLAGGTRLLAGTIVHPNRATVKPLLAAAIAVAFVAGLASAFVVWGIQTAYAQAEAAGTWKEVERQLEAYRAEHPAKQP